jgi:hypothetical protein
MSSKEKPRMTGRKRRLPNGISAADKAILEARRTPLG